MPTGELTSKFTREVRDWRFAGKRVNQRLAEMPVLRVFLRGLSVEARVRHKLRKNGYLIQAKPPRNFWNQQSLLWI